MAQAQSAPPNAALYVSQVYSADQELTTGLKSLACRDMPDLEREGIGGILDEISETWPKVRTPLSLPHCSRSQFSTRRERNTFYLRALESADPLPLPARILCSS